MDDRGINDSANAHADGVEAQGKLSGKGAALSKTSGEKWRRGRGDRPGWCVLMQFESGFPKLGKGDGGPAFNPTRVWAWLAFWLVLLASSVGAQTWWDVAHVQVDFNGIWYLQQAGFWLGSGYAWSWSVALVTGLWGFLLGFAGFAVFAIVSARWWRVGRWGMVIAEVLTVQSLAAWFGHGLASIVLYERYVRGQGLPSNSSMFDDPRISGWQSHWLGDANALSVQWPGLAAACVLTGFAVLLAVFGLRRALGSLARLHIPARLLVPLSLLGIVAANRSWSVVVVMLVVFAVLFALVVIPNDFKTVSWLGSTRRVASMEIDAAYVLVLDIVVVWVCVYAAVNGLW